MFLCNYEWDGLRFEQITDSNNNSVYKTSVLCKATPSWRSEKLICIIQRQHLITTSPNILPLELQNKYQHLAVNNNNCLQTLISSQVKISHSRQLINITERNICGFYTKYYMMDHISKINHVTRYVICMEHRYYGMYTIKPWDNSDTNLSINYTQQ